MGPRVSRDGNPKLTPPIAAIFFDIFLSNNTTFIGPLVRTSSAKLSDQIIRKSLSYLIEIKVMIKVIDLSDFEYVVFITHLFVLLNGLHLDEFYKKKFDYS
jgi:hypothetical protein